MEEKTNEQRIKEYNEKLEYCKTGGCLIPSAIEKKIKIGDYELARLRYLDDIYNHAYIEENYNYIINKDGVPFKLCETFAGNANPHSSQSSEINKNDKLLDGLARILVFIDFSKKLPHSLKYGELGKELENSLNDCLSKGDFSKMSLSKDIDKSVFDKMIAKFESKLSEQEKNEYIDATCSRTMKTAEEFYEREM